MTERVNIHTHPDKVAQAVAEGRYVPIHRPHPFGNPFKSGRDGTKAEVIYKYAAWVKTQAHLMKLLPSLKGKVLGCFCTGFCHGDVLLSMLEDL